MAINELIFGLAMLLGSLMVPFSALYLALHLRRWALAAPAVRRAGVASGDSAATILH